MDLFTVASERTKMDRARIIELAMAKVADPEQALAYAARCIALAEGQSVVTPAVPPEPSAPPAPAPIVAHEAQPATRTGRRILARTMPGRERLRTHWTTAERERLLNLLADPKMTYEEAGVQLGRSAAAIQTEATRLKREAERQAKDHVT